MADEQVIENEVQEEEAVEPFYSPIRVYRIADGSLATEPDSSGKSTLAYSEGKEVAEDDIAEVKALAGIVDEVEAEPEAEEEQSLIEKIIVGKPKKKRSKK
jgi:hypothetical protein|tara:strand:- start:15241 stop:15543 length:303 start_codon:yes stop_codon:yes gene_type:complete